MNKELTVLESYTNRVYKIIMLIIPLSCLSASITVTTLHYLGYFEMINEVWMWIFNFMDLGFLLTGIFFILTGFDSDGTLKKDKLFAGKYTAAMIAIIQWNAISYIWPFRDFWAYILLFILGEAFFFDIKLVFSTSVGLLSSTFISWFINGEYLLPIKDEYFIANMTFRIICMFVTVICINVLTFFGGKFLVEELEKYVYNDPLTDLLTRRTMDGYIQEAYKDAKKKNKPFCLVMVDIDDFKKVNDSYGHECGDSVLKLVSGIISSGVSPEDKVFRWGGEEILILMKSDKMAAAQKAESIRERIQNQSIFYSGNAVISVTATIGLTEFDPALSIDEMMEEVDKNLYEGKHLGKNRLVYH